MIFLQQYQQISLLNILPIYFLWNEIILDCFLLLISPLLNQTKMFDNLYSPNIAKIIKIIYNTFTIILKLFCGRTNLCGFASVIFVSKCWRCWREVGSSVSVIILKSLIKRSLMWKENIPPKMAKKNKNYLYYRF